MKKTRRQRRAIAQRLTNIQNAAYYAKNKVVLLAKQKAIRDDKREDLLSNIERKP